MTTYRIYLRTHSGGVSEKTVTASPDAAHEAFTALVNRTDLDGQKIAAALTCDNQQLAFHWFDRSSGQVDYWRDRLNEIELLARPVGRPSEMEGGRRVNLYLDAESLAIAERLGAKGNVSDGVRKALKHLEACTHSAT